MTEQVSHRAIRATRYLARSTSFGRLRGRQGTCASARRADERIRGKGLRQASAPAEHLYVAVGIVRTVVAETVNAIVKCPSQLDTSSRGGISRASPRALTRRFRGKHASRGSSRRPLREGDPGKHRLESGARAAQPNGIEHRAKRREGPAPGPSRSASGALRA